MCRKLTLHLPSSDGESNLHCVLWMPEHQCAAVLQLFHGMSEHILRYGELAEYLCARGIAVVGHDHLGHGNTASKETYGYFANKDGHICLIKDMHRVASWVDRRFSGVPHFMMGHSMGSFFLRRYLTVYEAHVDGIILMGTGDHSLPLLLAGSAMTGIIGALRGEMYRSSLMYHLVLGSYNRAFKPNRTDNDWLSRENDAVDSYCGDERCNFRFTCSAYRDFFHILLSLKLGRREGKSHGGIPVLLMSGEKDPVGGCGRGVRRVYRRFSAAGVKDLTMKLYPDDRHELLHETDREQVFEDIYVWLKARME